MRPVPLSLFPKRSCAKAQVKVTKLLQIYKYPRALLALHMSCAQYFVCLEKFNLHSSNCWKSSSTSASTVCAATCRIVVYVPNLEESPAMIFCLVSSGKKKITLIEVQRHHFSPKGQGQDHAGYHASMTFGNIHPESCFKGIGDDCLTL